MLQACKSNQWLKFVIGVLIFSLSLSACAPTANVSDPTNASAGVISVVAAENFYSDIARQIGGEHVSVTSILSDPNVDPHEYESNVQNAIAVSDARLVIENGDGYDAWMDKLLSASPNPNRVLLTAANVVQHKLPDNVHYWYSPNNMENVAQAIADSLKKLDPKDAAEFDSNLAAFKQSLDQINQSISTLHSKYAGTPVALTETIFLYQTELIGLNVLTPFDFEKAVAEGNDPPADAVALFNNQIAGRQVKVLIYNSQTVTPVTTNLQNEAKQMNIPIVAVSETMPSGNTYQQWMLDQLQELQTALGG
ncbi:MAG: zinc ABC transporter substrate-binding protein [Chloroflexi bacterium]|nr:zinc ABC transporter substrate-binding protein [Chloroflexota bacterium]